MKPLNSEEEQHVKVIMSSFPQVYSLWKEGVIEKRQREGPKWVSLIWCVSGRTPAPDDWVMFVMIESGATSVKEVKRIGYELIQMMPPVVQVRMCRHLVGSLHWGEEEK